MKKAMAAIILALSTAAGATPMDVATFISRGAALQRQGAAAVFTPEFREVQGELRSSTAAVRRERLLAIRAGRTPAYCPPPGASLSEEEVQRALMAVPPAQRPRTRVRDAIRSGFMRKYPCHS